MNVAPIAFRNISRQKKRSFLLGGAIAFGIMIITLINGFTAGMVENTKENMSHLRSGHLYISGRETTDSGKTLTIIRDDKAVYDALDTMGVEYQYITKRSNFRGSLIFGSKTVTQTIEGVNWDADSYIKDKLVIQEGSLDDLSNPKAVILSAKTATDLGVQVGEQVLVKLTTVTGQQNVDEFTLIATTVDQSFFGGLTGYANISYVNRLLNIAAHEYQTLNIFLEDMENMDDIALELTNELGKTVLVDPREEEAASSGGGANPMRAMGRMMGGRGGAVQSETWEGTRFRISTLNDSMGFITTIVDVLNGVGMVIFIILLTITMVGIANTFRMILLERVKEIGTMRAVGMQREEVRNIFLLEALFIALGGAVAGILVSFVVMFFVSLISLGTNTPFFLFLSKGHITFDVTLMNVLGSIVILSGLSLLAAMRPAQKAAKLEPVKALSSHY